MFEEIPEIAEAESYSISSAQKRLYLLDQLTGPGTTYNIPLVIKLKVKPDNERLQRALDQLVEQEEILRTSFHIVNGEPIQKISSDARIVLEHSEVNTADSQYIQDEYNTFVQPFDLSKSPLMRAKILILQMIHTYFWIFTIFYVTQKACRLCSTKYKSYMKEENC